MAAHRVKRSLPVTRAAAREGAPQDTGLTGALFRLVARHNRSVDGASKVVNVEAVVSSDARAPARPETAFDQLFLAEYAAVVRIARRVVADAAEAEDVAQDVFLEFHRRHPDGLPHAAAWLRAATVHTALNAVRSRTRRARREAAHAPREDPIDPQEVAEVSEARREVREALARLPERSAAVLALRYAGLSYAEVATAMRVDAGQVGTMLRRAEARLRKELR